MMPGTSHEDYLNEPASVTDWFLAFHKMDQEVQKALNERDQRWR